MQIQIKHPTLGKILINSQVEDDINEKIGTITEDYSKYPQYYHAKIEKNKDETFSIRDLHIIQPETITVGMMRTSTGGKSFITVITNRLVEEGVTVVYPSGVLSVNYK